MSQFLTDNDSYSSEYAVGINFDNAVRITGGGSTCDIFKTRWQRRDVFVKRLKEEFRFKPLYLDALDKEYEIGVGLKHPSLPDYREFHRDYIVMDYIDGLSLAEMLRRKDSWLSKEKHICSMLRQLVEVVDYLHRHNVVHCDIKPDNIMITTNGHNLVLVDFDKSYTDALNDTSGHPGKYGLPIDNIGRMAIDFRGIGKVAERIKAEMPGVRFRNYKKFVKTCHRSDVTCDEIDALLDQNYSSGRMGKFVFTGMVALCLMGAVVGYLLNRNGQSASTAPRVVSERIADTVRVDSNQSYMATTSLPPVQHNDTVRQTAIKVNENAGSETCVSAVDALDESIRQYFDQLVVELDRLEQQKTDTTLTREQLVDCMRSFRQIEDIQLAATMSEVHQMFPAIKEGDLGNLISGTSSYKRYIRRAKSIKRDFWAEIDRRPKNE